jgi:hypothetical protein
MKNILILLILVIIPWVKQKSQNYYCNCNIRASENILDIERKLSGRVFINNFINHNSQFFYKWAKGDVILYNGKLLKDNNIRYNHYLDELIWLRKSDYKAAIVDKQSVGGFIIYNDDNTTYAYFKRTKIKDWYASDTSNVYLQVLAEGPVSLYALRKIELIQNVIHNSDKYYLLLENNYYYFKPSRFRLLRFFPENRPELRKIFRKNNLKVRHESDLVKAIILYNNSIDPDKQQ